MELTPKNVIFFKEMYLYLEEKRKNKAGKQEKDTITDTDLIRRIFLNNNSIFTPER